MSTNAKEPEWTTVATFNRLSDAQELEWILRTEGIEARVYDERSLQRLWFWVHPKAGIHVQVDKSRVELAEAYFHDDQKLLLRAVRCPECGSSRVQYPAVTRKNMLPALMDHVFTLVGMTPAAYYCESCHYTWNRPHRDSKDHLKSTEDHLHSNPSGLN